MRSHIHQYYSRSYVFAPETIRITKAMAKKGRDHAGHIVPPSPPVGLFGEHLRNHMPRPEDGERAKRLAVSYRSIIGRRLLLLSEPLGREHGAVPRSSTPRAPRLEKNNQAFYPY